MQSDPGFCLTVKDADDWSAAMMSAQTSADAPPGNLAGLLVRGNAYLIRRTAAMQASVIGCRIEAEH